MFGKLGNMANMMHQAQQMQDRMNVVKKEIEDYVTTGTSGGGAVKITVTGSHHVNKVEIADSVLKDDHDMCEDLIAAAFNDATRRIDEYSQEKMRSVTAGVQLPPGFKMPF